MVEDLLPRWCYTYFWPRDLLMQPTGTVWTTLIGGTTQGSFLWSLVKIQEAVSEEMLFKEIVDGRTTDIERSQKLTEHFVLRWAKNDIPPNPKLSMIFYPPPLPEKAIGTNICPSLNVVTNYMAVFSVSLKHYFYVLCKF